MSDENSGGSTALEAAAPQLPVGHAVSMMNDDEIRRAYRIAEALYASGAYKDVKAPATAFAKIVVGRDLGLSAAQAMSGIHLVEGGVQMHYAMLGQFVRGREGYDYRPGWIKKDRRAVVAIEGDAQQVTVLSAANPDEIVVRVDENDEVHAVTHNDVVRSWDEQTVVWHDEEDPADMREIVGAVIEFTVGDKRRGISRFTLDDANQAGLIKADKPKAAWNAAPRNMLLARAISNGVKWFVPEVLGGLPVYTEGELEARERPSLTAGTGGEEVEPQGIDLGPKVEKLIERATKLGHRGLSNRAAVEMAIGDRGPNVINEWVERAKAELDRFEAEKAAAAEAEPEADPAPATGEPEERPIEAPAEEVTAEPVEEEDDRPPVQVSDDARARLDDVVEEAPETTVDPRTVEGETA